MQRIGLGVLSVPSRVLWLVHPYMAVAARMATLQASEWHFDRRDRPQLRILFYAVPIFEGLVVPGCEVSVTPRSKGRIISNLGGSSGFEGERPLGIDA